MPNTAMPAVSHLSDRRFDAALTAALLRAGPRTDKAAADALRVITRALRCDAALLIVWAATGRPQIFGNADLVADLNPHGDRTRFLTTEDLDGAGTLTLAIARDDRRTVIRPQQRLAGRAARMLAAWAVGIIGGSEPIVDRRGFSRPLDQEFERAARRALSDGSSASVVLIRTEHVPPAVAHRLVARVRTNVRAYELAGAISGGDIAVVLFGASAPETLTVATRMRRLIEADLVGTTDPMAIGIAHLPAGSPWPRPLLAAAREDAEKRRLAGFSSEGPPASNPPPDSPEALS